MKGIKKHFKSTHGYTLIEVLLALTIFAIGIIPIYQMIASGAKVQNVAEETYQATLHSQALLQDVKNQIEADLGEAYKISRGLPSLGVESWLDCSGGVISPFIVDFLEIDEGKFKRKYSMEDYLYEVHIWPMKNGKAALNPISFIAYKEPISIPGFTADNTSDFTKIEINEAIEQYFQDNESMVWAGQGGLKPIGIGELVYKAPDAISIRAKGVDGYGIVIDDIAGYGALENTIKLTYKAHDDVRSITHELIVEDIISSVAGNIVQMSIDLTTFPSSMRSKIIRIENRTKATVVVPVYNEKNNADIQIYPIQQNEEGKIVIEDRPKLEPSKNFIIGIIVKDASNIAYGEENKVLSKIVDIYSLDYNKQ